MRWDERSRRLATRVADAYGLLLLVVVASYAVASLIGFSGWSAVVILALEGASGVLALASSGAPSWLTRSGIGVALASVACAAIAAGSGHTRLLGAAGMIVMVLLLVAVGAVLRDVISQREVGFRTILGAISVYMIFGLLFTSLYLAIDRLQSGPFFEAELGSHTGNFVFFSFTTLTTTGYGNLVPAAQPGKMFAGLEMLFGQIFLVTLIAGLVSLWRPARRGGEAR